MFTDSHCHLDKLDLSAYNDNLSDALDAAMSEGVSQFLCIGLNEKHWPRVEAIAEAYPNVYASVGFHPLDLSDEKFSAGFLKQAATNPKVVAIGETGLDYHYQKETRPQQLESFEQHLEIAKSLALPVVVHTREAKQDTLDLLRGHACPEKSGVLHCFTEDWEMAKQGLDLNFYISFSGIVTFSNANALREVVKKVPLDRLLIETDAPYLAPVPFRGKPNEPKYLPAVATRVAELKGVSVEELAEITNDNFQRLFLAA